MIRGVVFLLLCSSFFLFVNTKRGKETAPPYYFVLNYDSYSLPSCCANGGYRLITMEELNSENFQNYYIENEGIPTNLSLSKYQSGYACNVFVQEGWLMYPKTDRLRAEMLTLQLDDGKNNCSAAGYWGTSNLLTDTDCSKIYNSILFLPNQTTLSPLLANTFPTNSTCDYPNGKFYHNYSLLILDYTSSNQVEGLKDLYMATGGGTTWEKKEGWLEGDPCVDKWYGVSCSYSTLSGWNVSSLGLRNNGLTGTLPSSLSNSLPHLSSIDFRNNSLSGPLPPLTDLENLSTLHLDTNSLSGSLPPFPPNLQYLSCDFNEFSGTFPKFSTRQGMSCSNNMFTRAERISVSKDLDLSHNHFNNFSDFYGNYYHTTGDSHVFNLSYNHFNEPLPTTPVFNDNMQIHLENNNFTGDLTGLGGVAVYLANNSLNGKIVGDYKYYPTSLYVENNNLHGVIDPAICTRVTYKSDFSGNNFACPIPYCLPKTPCHSTFDYWPIYLTLILIALLIIPFIFFIIMNRLCGVTFSLFSYQRSEEYGEYSSRGGSRYEKFDFSFSRLEISGVVASFLFCYCILVDVFATIMGVGIGCESSRPDYPYDKCEIVGGRRFQTLLLTSTAYFWFPVICIFVVFFMGCWCSDSVFCCDLRGLGHNRCVTFITFVLFSCLLAWSIVYILEADCNNVGKDNYGKSQPDGACELNIPRLSWLSFVLFGLGLYGTITSVLSGRFDCVFAVSRVDGSYTSME